jgi:hypothetical protein
MKNQEKIRIFGQKQEKQDIFKKSGKSQESSTAARPESIIKSKTKALKPRLDAGIAFTSCAYRPATTSTIFAST